MCKVKHKTRKEKVVGYKAVLKIGKNYYSPSTGLKYNVGMKLPNMKVKHKNAESMWINFLNKTSSNYSSKMQGKTGVFRTLKGLKQTHLGLGYVILKMTLGGEIYTAEYGGQSLYVGSEILDMQLVK